MNKKDILKIFTQNPKESYQLSHILQITGEGKSSRKRIKLILKELVEEGKLHKFKSRRYVLLQSSDLITGKLSITSRGFGFLRPDKDTPGMEDHPDVFIKQKDLKGALDDDRVQVRLSARSKDRPDGRVVKILERATHEFVGRFRFEKKGGTVIPKDDRIRNLIYVPSLNFRDQLKKGVWVLCRILEFSEGPEPMIGEIVDVIGHDKDKGIDILLILRENGIVPEFPEEVENMAAGLPHRISKKEISRRKDLRDSNIFTIDPKTAKDFDDALSIERLPNGNYWLGVHIADVAHYVTPGSKIDDEAYARATSIYPVDRVIPMLPERLSNELCSLRPNEDSLVMSAFMEINPQGEVGYCEFCNAVIHSHYRLSYEEAQAIIEGDPELSKKYKSVVDDLLLLGDLSKTLIAMRQKKGALDLDVGETHVIFDDEGKVIDLQRRPRLLSHRLVEQCMILANEAVAGEVARRNLPGIYRIHDKPSQDKLQKLSPVMAHFGINIPEKKNVTPRQLQKILDQTKKEGAAGHLIRRVILRAMMRAEYSPENKGHYGLGSKCYSHFTSPIRRYPDLILHRILKEIISPGGVSDEKRRFWKENMSEWTDHCSVMERRADSIEYEARYILGLEFMQQFSGEEFDGIISSVANFGLFVELEKYPIEGMIPVESLGREYFTYDESSMSLVGGSSGLSFHLGDRILVSMEKIDVMKQKMDLSLITKYKGKGTAKKKPASKKKETKKTYTPPRKKGGRRRR